jgi:preprotein translocase subunit SecE
MASPIVRTRDFTLEVYEELRKVTWPDQAQLKSATIVILVFCAIVSAVIWVMDQGVNGVLSVITGVFAR